MSWLLTTSPLTYLVSAHTVSTHIRIRLFFLFLWLIFIIIILFIFILSHAARAHVTCRYACGSLAPYPSPPSSSPSPRMSPFPLFPRIPLPFNQSPPPPLPTKGTTGGRRSRIIPTSTPRDSYYIHIRVWWWWCLPPRDTSPHRMMFIPEASGYRFRLV